MTKLGAKRRRLPMVEAWLQNDPPAMERIAEKTPSDHRLYPHYRALWIYDKAARGHHPLREADASLREALNAPPDDLGLYLALLVNAASSALKTGRAGEARRIMTLVNQLGEPLPGVEWKVQFLLMESSYFAALGQSREALETLHRALAFDLRLDSALEYRARATRMLRAIEADDPATAELDLSELERHGHLEASLNYPLRFFKALLCEILGKAAEGLEVLGPASQDAKEHNVQWVVYLRTMLLLLAGSGEEARGVLDRIEKEPNGMPRYAYERLRTWEALARADLPLARTHAHRAVAQVKLADPQHLRVCITDLAKVELASRRPRAARLLLHMLDREEERPNISILWARLHLLEGDESRAAFHFKRVLETHRPEQIHHKLRYAQELSAPQLSRLWISATARPAQAPGKQVEARKPPEDSIPLIGETAAMRRVGEAVEKFAPLGQTVLLTGETGVGKEVVARRLHEKGSHPAEPFIAVNCASISDSLIEAELFGYVKGAFTGAVRDHVGLFVAAEKGTLFLDEIGLMSTRLQASLLRALESREVRPVGSTRVHRFHARILAATSVPLDQAIARGEFRPDLYYRLAALHLPIPPLRERRDDIPLLARHFLKEFCGEREVVLEGDLSEAMKRLPWPGNVRELKNEIQRLLILAGGRRTLTADLLGLLGRDVPEVSTPPSRRRRSTRIRRDQLRQLFMTHRELTCASAVRLLGCSRETAVQDLKALEEEGAIRRVRNHPSGQTSCFVRVE